MVSYFRGCFPSPGTARRHPRIVKNSQPLTGRDNGTLSPAALPKGRERSCLRAVSPATAAVVATLHKDDVTSLRHLLRVPATYVGLIASEKRARLLLDWLGAETAAHPALHAPADKPTVSLKVIPPRSVHPRDGRRRVCWPRRSRGAVWPHRHAQRPATRQARRATASR